jgi:hypothetical protein
MEPGLPKEEAGGQEEEWARDSEVNAEEERGEWAGREPERGQLENASAQNAGQRLLISCASPAIRRHVQPAEQGWFENKTRTEIFAVAAIVLCRDGPAWIKAEFKTGLDSK